MKKLIAISLMTLTLTTCGMTSVAATDKQETIEAQQPPTLMDMMLQNKQEQTLLQQQLEAYYAAQLRAEQIRDRIDSLSKHVGNTWYVFSGSTPEGWDCSGLVLWFYSKLGVELYHSATVQKFSGEIVDEPMPGDIVAFSYDDQKNAYHNGIYIGDGLFIHSPRPGTKTKLSLVEHYIGEHSKATYTRIDF